MNINTTAYNGFYPMKQKQSGAAAPGAKSGDNPRQSAQPLDLSLETRISEMDTVELSAQALEKEKDRNGKSEKTPVDLQSLQRQLEQVREQNEGDADRWRVYIKCLRIAMRIISGDTVPKEDHRYLAKNDPELYAKASVMKIQKADPKKLKRISDDEESDDKSDGKGDGNEDTPISNVESSENISITESESPGELASEIPGN